MSRKLQAFISRLHSNGQRFVPILDPFIHLAPNYGAYESGLQADAFLKDVSGKPYIGQVGSKCIVMADSQIGLQHVLVHTHILALPSTILPCHGQIPVDLQAHLGWMSSASILQSICSCLLHATAL